MLFVFYSEVVTENYAKAAKAIKIHLVSKWKNGFHCLLMYINRFKII